MDLVIAGLWLARLESFAGLPRPYPGVWVNDLRRCSGAWRILGSDHGLMEAVLGWRAALIFEFVIWVRLCC